MFSIKIGRGFEVSSQLGDFLVRFGRREFYWSRDTGFSFERVSLNAFFGSSREH